MVSPVLANVYRHCVLDLWFERGVNSRCRGEARRCRSADDGVCAFRYRDDAEAFYRGLPKRLEKFGLAVAPDKARCLRFSRFHLSKKRRFTFLGFEFYWMPDREGVARVKRRTAGKKWQAACRRIKTWIRDHRHLPGREFFAGLNRRWRGHYHSYGVRGNSAALYRFVDGAMRCTFKGLNRRGGQRRSFNWATFVQALERMQGVRPGITEVRRRRVFA
jgi:hypothetical protein